MKLSALLKDMDILRNTVSGDPEIGEVRYDSRAVQPGDLFVAIRGYETDGHKYIPSALEKGAAGGDYGKCEGQTADENDRRSLSAVITEGGDRHRRARVLRARHHALRMQFACPTAPFRTPGMSGFQLKMIGVTICYFRTSRHVS